MARGKPTTTTSAPSYQQVPTEYGTTSLGDPDNVDLLQVARLRRRRIMRWSIAGVAIGAMCAVVGFGWNHATRPTVDYTTAIAVASSLEGGSVDVWQSASIHGENRMMEKLAPKQWTKKSTNAKSYIRVDTAKQYQEIIGFGGAFTEAAALQFSKLSPEKQEEVLKLYFDKEEGAAYEFGRVPMGSCDFSMNSYNYAEVANDTNLEHFDDNVTHDTKLIIPFIQRALKKNPNMKLFLSPWSPPAWMKASDPVNKYDASMLGSASPNGLREEYMDTWALYFSKFISAYKKHGIPFWGLTPQNEPQFAAPWEACTYTAEYLAKFVGQHLGPIVKRDHPDIKIMVFDHNLGGLPFWANTIINDAKANKYTDGLAFHWYNYERFMDGVEFHEVLNAVHHLDESRFILSTESSNCPGVMHGADAWFRGQRYAHDIIGDLNNWVVGWVDWNLMLDHTGGPNHLGNKCDAPIVLDENEQDYFVQPMYYFIKHFSKFLPSGSRRIHSEVDAQFQKQGDAQLLPRYPVVLHACDGSARQRISLGSGGKLHIDGTKFCIDVFHMYWEGDLVTAIDCTYSEQKWRHEAGQLRMDFNVTFGDGKARSGDFCLQYDETAPPNDPRLALSECTGETNQQWAFNEHGLKSANNDRCLTAGYSFVQSAAFVTPAGKKVVVVLNENTEDAPFELQVDEVAISTNIPAGAIQTYTWE